MGKWNKSCVHRIIFISNTVLSTSSLEDLSLFSRNRKEELPLENINPTLPLSKVWEEGVKKKKKSKDQRPGESPGHQIFRTNKNSGTVASSQNKTTGYPGIFKFVI